MTAEAQKLKWCKCRKRNRPVIQFLPERRGFKVRFCDECARANMRRWARTRNVGMKPEDIRDAGD